MFPERYIIKPNLVKARYFQSAKNSRQNTEINDKENEIKEVYDGTFNIEDVLAGKKSKGKSLKNIENTTFDNVNYNPFGPNSQKKRTKDKLDVSSTNKNKINQSYQPGTEIDKIEKYENKNFNSNINQVNKSDQDITYEMEGSHFNEEEYKKQYEFYQKMLKENSYEHNMSLEEGDKNVRAGAKDNNRGSKSDDNNIKESVQKHKMNDEETNKDSKYNL